MPTNLKGRENERDGGKEWRESGGKRENENAPLGVHIPSQQIMQHATQNSDLLISSSGRLGFYKSPWPFSHYVFLSLPLSVPLACAREKQYGGDRLYSREETRLGGRAREDDEVEGGLGWRFKNISDCWTQGWATAVQQHTFYFSYFCCFFHNV